MQIKNNLETAEIIGKYNKLIIDARLPDGKIVQVFCSSYDIYNICNIGTTIYINKRQGESYRIPYEIEFVLQDSKLIYAKPNCNNNLFEEAFVKGVFAEFSDYTDCHRLQATDNLPHLDFELSNSQGDKCFVFVTNIYQKQGSSAVFPSEVNFFEFEMFEEMRKLRSQGYKTCVFMIVPRTDCYDIRFSWKLCPFAAGKIFEEAKNGLNFIGYGCNITKMSVTLSHNIPILY